MMILKKKEIKADLEEIISRLEETRNNALDMRESNEMGLQSRDHEIDYDENYGNYEEDIENLEAAIFEFGNFIDGIIQLIGEEIENLRSLIEKLDRTD